MFLGDFYVNHPLVGLAVDDARALGSGDDRRQSDQIFLTLDEDRGRFVAGQPLEEGLDDRLRDLSGRVDDLDGRPLGDGLADLLVDGRPLGPLVDERDVRRATRPQEVVGDDVSDGDQRPVDVLEEPVSVGLDRSIGSLSSWRRSSGRTSS